MSVTHHEVVGSPKVVVDMGNTVLTRTFHVEGSSDYNDAIQEIQNNTPYYVDVNGLKLNWRKFSTVEPVGTKDDLWKVVVEYTHVQYGGDLPTGQIEFLLTDDWQTQLSFSVSTESREVYKCIENTPVNVGGVTSPDVGSLVNVDVHGNQDDGGLEMLVPVCIINVSVVVPNSAMQSGWMVNTNRLAGKVNDSIWNGIAKRGCRFDGVQGEQRRDGKWQCDLSFSYRPIERDFKIDLNDGNGLQATGQNLLGWDTLWLRTNHSVDGNTVSASPRVYGVYKAQMYEMTNFNSYFWFINF